MTKKTYRTAQGKVVDMGALMLQNENVRAVGNMKANARGDIIDSNNKTIESRNRQVSRQYQRQSNVSDDPVLDKAPDPMRATQATRKEADKKETIARDETVNVTEPMSGLAAALARAREIKQEPLKKPNSPTNVKRF